MPERSATIRPATAADIGPVKDLLKGARLPVQGVEDQFGVGYAVAESGGKVVGAVGVEVYGRFGLLRSAVVAPKFRNTGLGGRLTSDRIDWARKQQLEALYLLTTTAAPFFSRIGFQTVARDSAPAEIQKSPEFAAICGSSAICMRLPL